MEDTRRSIRAGRRLAAAAELHLAVDVWKAALSGAYEAQDYAGMFVLAKNLGETTAQLAERQLHASSAQDATAAENLLQEAAAYIDYALGLVDQCALRGVLRNHRVLEQSVRRLEAKRSEAKKALAQLEQRSQQSSTPTAVESPSPVRGCTTCESADDKLEMVLDENDGCYYCRACYDEYYASMEVETTDLESIEQPVEAPVLMTESGVAEDELQEADGLEIEEESALVASPEIAPDSSREEDTPLSRWRHKRVELGSLADFLAGKGRSEDEDVLELEKEKVEESTPSNSAAPGDGLAGSGEVPAAVTEERHVADAGEGGPEGVEALPASGLERLEYSVAQLVEMRKQSPTDCPESLLSSPVRDDGRVATTSRTRGDTGKKGGKKSSRPSKGSQQRQCSQPSTSAVPAPSETSRKQNIGTTHSTSALPSLELCNALRSARQAGGCASEMDNTGSTAVGAMASALFDTQQPTPASVLPFAAQTRLFL